MLRSGTVTPRYITYITRDLYFPLPHLPYLALPQTLPGTRMYPRGFMRPREAPLGIAEPNDRDDDRA